MHSFSVNIRICQSENSDVHQGRAKVNITLEVLLILMLTKKRMQQLICYITLLVSLFLVLYSIYIFINLLKSDWPCALKTR